MSNKLYELWREFPWEDTAFLVRSLGDDTPERRVALWANKVRQELGPVLQEKQDMELQIAIMKRELELLSVEDWDD